MTNWSLDTIPWHEFDAAKVRPDLLCLAKAASMVEYNGYDYARYLCEVFQDDAEFQQIANHWAAEEVQHGAALRKWAEMADPAFDFEESFRRFTAGYKLPVGVKASVRGSRSGELIARCVVETGTSSYYTAIKESTDEPVLKAICGHIAADELRHYKLFYTHLKRYLVEENIGFWKRLRIALGRITESEDDELSYAFYAAHQTPGMAPYDRRRFSRMYLSCAYWVYRKPHVERMTAMVFKAVGLTPHTRLNRIVDRFAWGSIKRRTRKLASYRQNAMAGIFG
jgi:rubrerythrin